MFTTNTGRLRPDAETIAEFAATLPEHEIARLEEWQGTLKDAFNSFEARLEEIPERERKALLSLLYKDVVETIFDFRLSLEARTARREIQSATSIEEKLSAVRRFEAIMADVAMIHGK